MGKFIRRRVKMVYEGRTLVNTQNLFSQIPYHMPQSSNCIPLPLSSHFQALCHLFQSVNYFASFFGNIEDYMYFIKFYLFHLEFYVYFSPFLLFHRKVYFSSLASFF